MSEKDMEYIRVAAYYIWENEGRPEGKSEEIWWKACDQFNNWNHSQKAGKAVAKKSTAKKAVAKVAAKPVVKAAAIKAPAKKLAKTKISTVPVKSAATKIITPLYGSVKK